MEKFRQASALGKAANGLVDLGDLASDTLRPLKELLALAKQIVRESPAAGQDITQTAAQDLADLPVWPRLFPYLKFQANDDCRLLLLTVHKAFHGVFDGRRTMRLGSWEAQPGWRYVFVFDEFDFLENDLLGLLAADREVRDPFGLVATFYERLCRRKLTHRQYLARPEWQPIREALEAIRDCIESLYKNHQIDFPETTHFVTAEKNIRGRAIFQSNYSLVTQPVYLDPAAPREGSFTLTQASGKNVFTLFEVITRVVKDIIRLFNHLQVEHEDIYFEILSQCFSNTGYLQEVRQVNQIGAQHELSETNYGNLLANGFGLYEIETDKSPLSDPDEVALLYLSLNDSPEAMLRALAKKHLVFGLSATAHIERVLRNFDWTGLAQASHPADSFGPLPSTVADEADVRRANEAKAQKRNNTLTYEVIQPLLSTTVFGEQLAALAQAAPQVFGTGSSQGYRVQRAQHFFGLLTRLAALKTNALTTDQTHLVFLYSLRQVKHLLESGGDEDEWFGATPRRLEKAVNGLQMYDVWCYDETHRRRMSCAVVLYDAQFGQDLRNDLELHKEYNALFWEARPVVVVTTYASAGNGVNLQHYGTRADYEEERDEGKRDFCHLHLLEAPYYYFSGVGQLPTAAEQQAAIKRDVYGILKLLYAKRLSQAQALGELGHIRSLNQFNGTYLQTPDGMLNQFSVYVQALGRIERVWQPMPAQKLWLDRQVYGVFERVAAGSALVQERENYMRFASKNMATLLAAIAQDAPRQRRAADDELDDLREANEAARAAIHQLVLDIEQFKRSGGKPGEVRKRWQWLREDVLRHDMHRPLPTDEVLPKKPRANQLQRIRGTFRSHYAQAGRLLISRDLELAPPATLSPDFMVWELNAVYRPLTSVLNSPIAAHFRVRGYELAFVESGTYLLPYVYQSILVGAVGEEAITAVLRHAEISVSGAAVPDEVFEVADLKLDHHPVYIDCKNFGVRTLRHFALPPDDLLYHPKLNEADFKKNLIKKWATLKQVPCPTAAGPCRLVVMNLFDDEESALRLYDEHFEPVTEWAQARLVVLTGTLNPQATSNDDLLTPACTRLLTFLKRL